ncbi:MAG: WbuC family cupin fold metalloprotein [Desulfobacteraceae bacterium]|jgi:cupin fold WbuC family metalloprotein
MLKITDKIINETSDKAKTSKRKRCNHNFHKRYSDPIQRFLNAVEPDSYLRPHRHEDPDKTEIFLAIKGRVVIVEFDDNGSISDHFVLDRQEGMIGVEIPPKTWHSFIALREGSVLYEIKEGPFVEWVGMIFAEWAPEEGTEAAREFNEDILKELKLA